MDVIQTARLLGKAIQEDERYIAFSLAKERNDNDAGLQDMIGRFNQNRAALNAMLQNPERDQEKISDMNKEIKALYAQIFENGNMIAYNEAQSEFQRLLTFVNQIITGSADGLDPDFIEYKEACAGDCGGCSGCN